MMGAGPKQVRQREPRCQSDPQAPGREKKQAELELEGVRKVGP